MPSDPDRPRPLVETRSLRHTYPAPGLWGVLGRKRRGAGPLDLRVEAGECLALLGPNGSGKSTAIRLLCGLHSPAEGKARIAGHDPRSAEGRRSLGYVPELSPCPGHLTALAYLEYLAHLSGLDRATRRRRAHALLERFDLATVAHTPTRTFSRGMRRRLVLAQALIHEPRVLFLDEPTAGLDPPGSLIFENAMREHLARGGGIVIASHLSREVLELATHLLVLENGEERRSGPAGELLADPETWVLVLRDLAPEGRVGLREHAERAGASVVREGHEKRTIGELFERLLGERPGDGS